MKKAADTLFFTHPVCAGASQTWYLWQTKTRIHDFPLPRREKRSGMENSMIRAIITLLFAVIFLICMIPMQFVEFLIGKWKGQEAKDRVAHALINFAFKAIMWLSGVKLTVIGQENIPTDRAVLYIGNHRSIFDTIIGYTLVPGISGYISKIELKKVPLLSSWMKLIRCLFLDRNDTRQGLKVILAAIAQVKSGVSMWVFPEGTRGPAPDGKMLPFKEGSLKIAEKSGCPVVPLAIVGSDQVFEAHFPFIRSAHVTFRFGEPFYIKDLAPEDRKFSGAYTQKLIENMLEEME